MFDHPTADLEKLEAANRTSTGTLGGGGLPNTYKLSGLEASGEDFKVQAMWRVHDYLAAERSTYVYIADNKKLIFKLTLEVK